MLWQENFWDRNVLESFCVLLYADYLYDPLEKCEVASTHYTNADY